MSIAPSKKSIILVGEVDPAALKAKKESENLAGLIGVKIIIESVCRSADLIGA